ncbi:MAG: hypothetical protein RLZZ480_680 [Candidatus Parcubacteria bacterium]|jgi:hypothetical protein
MGKNSTQTGTTLFLYVLVQGVSRGGDWAIQNYLIYSFGGWFIFLPALLAGSIFNLSFGYIIQKTFVFNPAEERPHIPRRASTFVILRIMFGAGAFLTLLLLFSLWPADYWIYSGIIMVLMWALSYHAQRDVFTATVRTLPRPVRVTRVVLFRIPQKVRLRRKAAYCSLPIRT